jgi:hypothetical protein
MTGRFLISVLIVLAGSFGSTSLFGQSVPYFHGKTIVLIQGREPGGTSASRLQAAIPFLKNISSRRADDATPLLPEAQERAIKDIPRDAEIIALFKSLASSGPLPER